MSKATSKQTISFTQLKQLLNESRFGDKIRELDSDEEDRSDSGVVYRHVKELFGKLKENERDVVEAIILEGRIRKQIRSKRDAGKITDEIAKELEFDLGWPIIYSPAPGRTCVGFGGGDINELYIATSAWGLHVPRVRFSKDRGEDTLRVVIPPFPQIYSTGDNGVPLSTEIDGYDIDDNLNDWRKWIDDVEYFFKNKDKFFDKIEERYSETMTKLREKMIELS